MPRQLSMYSSASPSPSNIFIMSHDLVLSIYSNVTCMTRHYDCNFASRSTSARDIEMRPRGVLTQSYMLIYLQLGH